jgi:hypothetical protein
MLCDEYFNLITIRTPANHRAVSAGQVFDLAYDHPFAFDFDEAWLFRPQSNPERDACDVYHYSPPLVSVDGCLSS